ncbi:flagellar basal body P-ring protein FlgI [Methylobacter sp. S3L5C]|uniref:flagellar basal body P-ring protein FlgI n=1 Tax=Methylobacter sp. S3L5C TaxID=2839024 RepID=UPI001FAD1E46|nr:flagellar basal body P-ring protein FlgI [Methylobacter sp. S3L5C]UOA08756.1 flagellar basal body P-ring protein FlgI [Methylobacter sp. S3L5C]
MKKAGPGWLAISWCWACLLASLSTVAVAERMKDLANIQGVRENQLIGYGLVVGLEGTGDQTSFFSNQSVINSLQQMGVNVPQGINMRTKNTAAVVVTGMLRAFAQPGQAFDVTVSSMASAKSLRGGTLMLTSLKGADGQIYAMAQGNILLGGYEGSGSGSPGNNPIPGNIVGGATVERAVNSSVGQGSYVKLVLNENNFNMASRMVEVINNRFGAGIAEAQNGLVIQIRAPLKQNERVAFIGELEMLDIAPAQLKPKVVFNVRTGAVVINQAVTLDACAVSHGTLSIVVGYPPDMTPTMIVPNQNLMVLKPGVLLADVVKTLNDIGASPPEMLVILQSMKAAGALHAELEVN